MNNNEYGLERPKATALVDVSFLLDNVTSQLWLQLENEQITGSHKYRLVYSMMTDFLDNNMTDFTGFVEASSGNTGLALAKLAQQINKPVMLFVNQSLTERIKRKLVKYDNVTVVLCGDADDAVNQAIEFNSANPSYIHLNQYDNMAGALGFEELARTFPDKVTTVVVGVGTGASVYGIGRVLHDKRIIACTVNDDWLTIPGWRNLKVSTPGQVVLTAQGRGLINHWEPMKIESIIEVRKYLGDKVGIDINLSTAGNLIAAIKEANQYNDQVVLTLCTGKK